MDAVSRERRKAKIWRDLVDEPPSRDPAVRSLPLSEALLDTYLSWCPRDRRPALTRNGEARPIRGQLHLGIPGRFGIGPLFNLQGQSGWLRMDAVWIEADPTQQYLLCAIVAGRECPQQRVAPLYLWRVWQPTYHPRYTKPTDSSLAPPGSIADELDDAIETHLAQSLRSLVVTDFMSARNDLEETIEALTRTRDRLDSERRHLQREWQSGRHTYTTIREQLVDTESQLEEATRTLASLVPHPPPLFRLRLCEVQWFLASPTAPRTDP
jgi:hypothetical protein